MKTPRNRLLLTGTVTAVLIAFATMPGAHAQPPGTAPEREVTVINTASNPVPVSVSVVAVIPHEPFQWSDSKQLDNDATGTAFNLNVPAGKRLVIEMLTICADLPAGQGPYAFHVDTILGSVHANHFIPMFPGVGDGAAWTGGQLVKIYADPSTQISMTFLRRPAKFGGTVQVSLTGYFEPKA
jgi:hypothetical protein